MSSNQLLEITCPKCYQEVSIVYVELFEEKKLNFKTFCPNCGLKEYNNKELNSILIKFLIYKVFWRHLIEKKTPLLFDCPNCGIEAIILRAEIFGKNQRVIIIINCPVCGEKKFAGKPDSDETVAFIQMLTHNGELELDGRQNN